MNIFVLHRNPTFAANYHCDAHVVKMIVECGQLMSTAHHYLDGKRAPHRVEELLRPTHVSHPCAVWVRGCLWQYQWTHALMGGLLHNYTARYGRLHAYEGLWEALRRTPANIPMYHESGLSLTVPPQCMPGPYRLDIKALDDWDTTVEAYRNYYFFQKRGFANWTFPGREPEWFKERTHKYAREEP